MKSKLTFNSHQHNCLQNWTFHISIPVFMNIPSQSKFHLHLLFNPSMLHVQTYKLKCTLVQALRLCTGHMAHRGSRGTALPFLDDSTRRGWGVSVTSRPLFTLGKTRHPLYMRLGGPQSRPGQVRKISPPTGFDPRTVQPVASRYIDYATRPTSKHITLLI